MNLEEKAILADQVIEPFDLVQLQQNIGLSLEASWRGLCASERSEQHKP